MIPFFQVNIILLGPLTIQVWGLFVSLGIVVGIVLARILARKVFISSAIVVDLGIWALVGGIVGARLGHIFFYEPVYYLYHLKEVFFVWRGGASSLGGFLGAFVALFIFAWKRSFSWKEMLPYFDVLTLSLWLSWGIGRIGCFMIHDHIGRLSNFWLAVNFPEGARFDLGLLESILAFIIFVVFVFLFKKLIKLRWGLVFIYSLITFAVFRFGLDFLRADDVVTSDVRYWFLTPMQWGILVVLIELTVGKIYSKISARKS
jgi:phosphatidylglycerol:prolipoprotein diacylglycerol transferase